MYAPVTMNKPSVLSYAEMLDYLGDKRKHLLLGNGFSIGCDNRFAYPNLYQYACAKGLSLRAQAIFQRLGTNNFEGVMRLLEDARWVAKEYGVRDQAVLSAMSDDLATVKNALVEAIAETHLDHTGDVPDEKKARCLEFLSKYHNVFTTNYDLLLYLVAMSGADDVKVQDGFRSDVDDPDSEYLVFREHTKDNKGMFFLHGALHMYVVDGSVRKHSWIRSGERLTNLVRSGLESGDYPLFVAEGTAEKKRQQIQQSGYLSYCLGKLERIQNALVVYGHSLGDSDSHIQRTVADNPDLQRLAIGVYGGDLTSDGGTAIKIAADFIQRRRKQWERKNAKYKSLEIIFYDSKTAPVWRAARKASG
jgi:hypothetical protein